MKPLVVVLISAAGVLVLGAAAFFFFFKGPDLKPYLPLRQPRITTRADEPVLQVAFAGKAGTVIKEAYGVLFKTYFGLREAPKGPGMKPPKARYIVPADLPKDPAERFKEFQSREWRGAVAIPVPAGLVLGPQAAGGTAMRAELARWEYGEVAEILHLGPYEAEIPTVRMLEELIEREGYEAYGDHEEEYLKGPGMPFVSPKDYWTIIRYRVKKKAVR